MSHELESKQPTKLSAGAISARKGGSPIAMLALYDAPLARLAEAAGIDMILVGDSLGMAVLGMDSTTRVTLDNVIYHAQAVRRGAPHTHVVGDMPFMTYQVSDEQAVASAGRLVAEAGVDSVKLEGGVAMADRIRAITRVGIPVVAHIGLLPQTAGLDGGFRVQGKDAAAVRQLMADAHAVAAAGAFAVVIELVGAELAGRVTASVPIPTIGIGAGAECDGQVLVAPDMLGIDDRFRPRFLKTFADLGGTITAAFSAYADEVRSRAYPDAAHSFTSPAAALAALDDDDIE
jgi:3-methyl-2-oxobutanoate hydroxymethyltransferase